MSKPGPQAAYCHLSRPAVTNRLADRRTRMSRSLIARKRPSDPSCHRRAEQPGATDRKRLDRFDRRMVKSNIDVGISVGCSCVFDYVSGLPRRRRCRPMANAKGRIRHRAGGGFSQSWLQRGDSRGCCQMKVKVSRRVRTPYQCKMQLAGFRNEIRAEWNAEEPVRRQDKTASPVQ